jgi:hypothetical protein
MQRDSSIRDRVYGRIRQWILDGKLAPGAPLVASQLVGPVRASRTPVREALRQLLSDGLVRLGVPAADLELCDGMVIERGRGATELSLADLAGARVAQGRRQAGCNLLPGSRRPTTSCRRR